MTRLHNKLLTDKNAACKQRLIKCNQLSYTNDNVRKAINVKAALMRTFLRLQTDQSGTLQETKKSSDKN